MEYITLSPPKPDKDYIETLLGQVNVSKFKTSAQELTKPDPANGWTGMSSEKAMRQVMIMNNEPGVTDESHTIDFTDNAKAAAGDIGHILRAAAPIAEAVSRSKGSRGGGKRRSGS